MLIKDEEIISVDQQVVIENVPIDQNIVFIIELRLKSKKDKNY